jgi:hypothetical protein
MIGDDVSTKYEVLCGLEQILNQCCHDLIWSAMWIWKDVIGSFHEKFDVIWKLEQMIDDDVIRNLRWYVERNIWYRMLSWPNIYIAIFIGKNVTRFIQDLFELLYGLERMILDDVLI